MNAMFTRFASLVLIPVAGCASSVLSPAVPASAVQQVTETEKAFAQSMADRDFKRFASFIADDAIFVSGPQPLRGRDAVLKAWQPYFVKNAAPFSWSPQQVEVLASGDLAYSTGPVREPNGTISATFHSIWRRDTSGGWKIVFDRGSDVCGTPSH